MSSRVALVEVIDRDGQVRQSVAVERWPLSIGRSLDNDVVLADPHVAPHHARIGLADPDGSSDRLQLTVGDTRNGVRLGPSMLASGASAPIGTTGEAASILLGRTRLRLRLPGHAVEPELPLVAGTRLTRWSPVLLATLALVLGMLFNTWVDADPDTFARNVGSMAVGAVMLAALWCGGWALLSRIFTRHAQLGWHVRVFVYASLAWLVVEAVPPLLAFAFDWPWIADFGFVGTYAVAGAALYFHLLAVEPARPRLMRAVGAVAAIGGIALAMWFNHQRSDHFGEDLYMSHLLPPALRVARPVTADVFIDRLAPLQATLDRKAKEPPRGDGSDLDVEHE